MKYVFYCERLMRPDVEASERRLGNEGEEKTVVRFFRNVFLFLGRNGEGKGMLGSSDGLTGVQVEGRFSATAGRLWITFQE
jgi:hypothetical protein